MRRYRSIVTLLTTLFVLMGCSVTPRHDEALVYVYADAGAGTTATATTTYTAPPAGNGGQGQGTTTTTTTTTTSSSSSSTTSTSSTSTTTTSSQTGQGGGGQGQPDAGGNVGQQYFYIAFGVPAGASKVQLVDTNTWQAPDSYGTTFTMSFDHVSDVYTATVSSGIAPKRFEVMYLVGGKWEYSTGPIGGTCTQFVEVDVVDFDTGLPIDPFGFNPTMDCSDFCHQVIGLDPATQKCPTQIGNPNGGNGGNNNGGGNNQPDAGAPPPQGTVTVGVTVVALDQNVNHTFVASDWLNPDKNVSGKIATFSFTGVPAGSEFVFNGTTDGKWWAAQGNVFTSIVGVTVNGTPVHRWAQINDQKTGSNIHVIASATSCQGDDDCDGVANGSDCQPQNQLVHPGQLAVVGGNVAYDCSQPGGGGGGNNPPPQNTTYVYAAYSLPAGVTKVQLVDTNTWQAPDVFSSTYVMSWDANAQAYTAIISSAVAPKHFEVMYLLNGTWGYSTGMVNGTCTRCLTVKVWDQTTGNAVDANGLVPAMDCLDFCHQVINLAVANQQCPTQNGQPGGGGGGNNPPPAQTGTLDVFLTTADMCSNHTVEFHRASDWNNPVTKTGTSLAFSFSNVAVNTTVDVQALVDGNTWLCQTANGVNTRTQLISAKWNGVWTSVPTIVSNGQGGCNIRIMAAAGNCGANDVDCDGALSGTDCNDNDQARFPGQIQPSCANISYNCGQQGGGGNNPPPVQTATLQIITIAQNQGVNHNYTLTNLATNQSFTANFAPIGVFNFPNVAKGSTLTFTGNTDGTPWLTAGQAPTVIRYGTWNGSWIKVTYNTQTAQFTAYADPSLCGVNDYDCDGSPSGTDCDDNDARRTPGNFETTGDGVDTDCDGKLDPQGGGGGINPPPAQQGYWRYAALSGIPQGATSVALVDGVSMTSYSMTYYQVIGYWSVDVPQASAPKQFFVRWTWLGVIYESTYTSNGACLTNAVVQVWDPWNGQYADPNHLTPVAYPQVSCDQVIGQAPNNQQQGNWSFIAKFLPGNATNIQLVNMQGMNTVSLVWNNYYGTYAVSLPPWQVTTFKVRWQLPGDPNWYYSTSIDPNLQACKQAAIIEVYYTGTMTPVDKNGAKPNPVYGLDCSQQLQP